MEQRLFNLSEAVMKLSEVILRDFSGADTDIKLLFGPKIVERIHSSLPSPYRAAGTCNTICGVRFDKLEVDVPSPQNERAYLARIKELETERKQIELVSDYRWQQLQDYKMLCHALIEKLKK